MKAHSLLLLLALSVPATSQSFQQSTKEELAALVKAEFMHSWNAYKKYAWGQDGLRPLTKTGYTWYSVPLYMTALDALDTMILMGFKEEADSVREFIARNLRVDHDIYVKNFEITIRILGGLISSYQLSGDQRLLALADDLGARLLPVFDTPTGIPYVEVNLKTGEIRNPRTNPGEVGTLLIEFGALSKLTGKQVYYNTAKKAVIEVYKRRSDIGLVGTWMDANTGEWLDPDSHLSACIDSYYEYMIKCWLLFGDHDLKDMWDTSIVAIKKHLSDETPTGLWFGHADMFTGRRTKTWFGALDAFFPGTLVLAGDIETAARLQESCFKMWNRHGIEPEDFDYSRMEAARPRYFLNPEIMESAYYLYQATHDPRYLEMGKAFLDSLMKYCRLDEGYSELKSVLTKEKSDRMESYFLSETLKYLYLLFAPPKTVDLDSTVFNTEAHPIRRTW
ncbi:MAG: glycoside hydrolase family 47 protein [Bacteroidota bacterium]